MITSTTETEQDEMNIILPTKKNGIANLRVLAEAATGNSNINVHHTNGKPNLYSTDGGMKFTAGQLADNLKMIIECTHGETTYTTEHCI
jgi:hypothetical protein